MDKSEKKADEGSTSDTPGSSVEEAVPPVPVTEPELPLSARSSDVLSISGPSTSQDSIVALESLSSRSLPSSTTISTGQWFSSSAGIVSGESSASVQLEVFDPISGDITQGKVPALTESSATIQSTYPLRAGTPIEGISRTIELVGQESGPGLAQQMDVDTIEGTFLNVGQPGISVLFENIQFGGSESDSRSPSRENLGPNGGSSSSSSSKRPYRSKSLSPTVQKKIRVEDKSFSDSENSS